MSGDNSWVDPDWDWLEPIEFEDAPWAFSMLLAVILLGGMGFGLLAALWFLL